MKHKFFMTGRLAGIALIAALFFSNFQVNGQQENRDVSGFSKISYSLPGDLEIMQGSKEELILIGDQEDLEKIVTEVKDGKLKIYLKKDFSKIDHVTAKVTVKELNALAVAGSGNVDFTSDLKTEEFDLELSGSGNIHCEKIIAEEVDMSLAGSGNVQMGGEAEELEISIAGSGNVNCAELRSSEVDVSIAGSGNAKVWATGELKSSIAGSGGVYYKGNPLVDAETSGSGKTKPL